MLQCEDLRHPYPGLRPFEPVEADLFFGREDHVDALLDRLARSHFVAVVGESGAGKSSLVRAGLVPALEAGFVVEAGSDWRVAVMRPGASPLTALADALLAPGVLSDSGGRPHRDFAAAELRRGPLGIAQLLRDAHLGPSCNLLLVVDQFEEVFRYCREPGQRDQASVFVELLLHASRQRQVPVFVVLTMRSDFIGECARFRGLPEALNDNQYLTPRLTRDQIASAIREPARVCGGTVHDDLVDQLCNAVGDDQDQLPLLQHLLMRLWDEASRQGQPAPSGGGRQQPPWPCLTSELSVLVGGLKSALDRHAQQIYESLSPDGRHTARSLFKCLSDPRSQHRDLRRDALVSEVAAIAAVPIGAVIAVADEFRAAGRHMLMPPPAVALDDGSRLDISHESLLRQWSTLSEWAREERINAREFDRLREEAQREQNEQGELLSGRDLARARDWQRLAEPTPAWAERYAPTGEFEMTLGFIQRSEAQAKQRRDEEALAATREAQSLRNRRYAWVFGGAVVLATVVAMIISTLWLRAERNLRVAKNERQRADEATQLANKNAQTATDLATDLKLQREYVEVQNQKLAYALEQEHTDQHTSQALLALEQDDAPLALLLARRAVSEGQTDARAIGALRSAIASHVPSVASSFPVATSRHYVPNSGKRVWLDFSLSPSSVSARGDMTIVPSGKNAIIWSTTSGQAIRTLTGHTGIVGSASFSPNGELAVTTSADRTARLWNVATGRLVQTLAAGDVVNNAIFNAAGTMLVVMADNDRATVWDVGHYGSPACELPNLGNFIEASFSVDQRLLLTVTHRDSTWDAQVWNVEVEGCPREIGALDGVKGIRWASFSPYGPWLGVVTVNGEGRVFSTSDWASKRTLPSARRRAQPDEKPARIDAPAPMAWSSDGQYVAVAGRESSVQIAALDDVKRPPVQLRGHTGWITSMAFNRRGDVLLTTSKDRTARVWRLRPDKTIVEIVTLSGHKDAVGSGAFAADGHTVVTAGEDGHVRAWKPVFALQEAPAAGVLSAAYSADGKHIWLTARRGSQDDEGLWRFRLAPESLAAAANALKIGSKSATVIGPSILEDDGGRVSLRDLRDPTRMRRLAEPFDPARTFEMSPGGRFAFSPATGEAHVWQATGTEVRSFTYRLPAPIKRFETCQPKAIADDGQLAWYCPNSDAIVISRARTGRMVLIERADAENVKAMRFSPNGRRLAAILENFAVEVFDTGTGRRESILRGNNASITGTDFSADERFFVSTSDDSTARVWDVQTGAQFATVTVSGLGLRHPVFSPDGRSLLLLSTNQVLMWRCHACGGTAALLESARLRRVNRVLTPQEEVELGVSSEELGTERALVPRARPGELARR